MAIDYGWDRSASAWVQFVNEGDPSREHILDGPMLELCGDVEGKRVLDVGCGEGRFCRMLAKRGGVVTGIDPTDELIEAARMRDPDGDYRIAVAEDLPFESETFDLVVSYVVLVDIPDFRKGIIEMARVLSRGGEIVVANLNPFVTAVNPPWVKDANKNRLHLAVDNYMEERADHVAWRGIEVINFHRPMASYIQAFLKAGLILDAFDEPIPSELAINAVPDLDAARRVPYFHVMRWRKP